MMCTFYYCNVMNQCYFLVESMRVAIYVPIKYNQPYGPTVFASLFVNDYTHHSLENIMKGCEDSAVDKVLIG